MRINGREAEYIKRLQNTENWHPSWLVYRYAGRFLEGPSEVALASALQSLAESFVPNWGEQSENRILRLPWPISACLTVCKSSSELLEMAEKARSGELGDVGDWLAAEIRWSEDGITKEDLMSMTADRSPFDVAIRDVGFPTALRFLPVMIGRANHMNLWKSCWTFSTLFPTGTPMPLLRMRSTGVCFMPLCRLPRSQV